MSQSSQIYEGMSGNHGYKVAGKSKMRFLGGNAGQVLFATDRRYLVAPTGQFIRLNPNGTPMIRERNRRTKGAK